MESHPINESANSSPRSSRPDATWDVDTSLPPFQAPSSASCVAMAATSSPPSRQISLLPTDEDLENMIEEYDRTTSVSPLKPSRLRLFLFPSKPETAASMGSLLDDAKSETWFVDALNGAGLLPRGLSESAAIDTLLELNNRGIIMVNSGDSCADLEAQNDEQSLGNINKQVVCVGKSSNAAQEMVLDSPPMMETSSSFGSSTSTPSMANLPPIKVRGTEGYMMVGLDEQFSHQVSIASSLANAVSPPPGPCVGVAATSGGGGLAVGGENVQGRVICDDEKSEKSDHGTVAPTGLRKPPLPLQPVQRKLVDIHNLPSPDSKHAGGYNLPSPDSVASDCSIASAGSLSKHTTYQDMNRENRVPTPLLDPKTINNIQEPPNPPQISIQQQQQQQQFINHQAPPPHYIQQHSYYPMYLHPQTQKPQPIQHHQTDPQYPPPMYLLPPGLTPTQPCYDASNRSLTPPPPHYQTNKPEMAASANMSPMYVHVPTSNQYQQQYINLSQIPNQGQPNNVGGYEYSHHMQDQVYYGQHMAASAPPPPSQYQTMTPAAAAVMYSQASAQPRVTRCATTIVMEN
ncbi:hypothetical protein DH2020_038549 [Rehmannia glutinosa]|uniref:Uncharacterized protein n=1 Tax=Rehmannia glutinosa TaxID=99300 RepID=A0ABR0UZE9_REHGL